MGAAEEKRNVGGSSSRDTAVRDRGIREQAPGKGAADSDITTHLSGKTRVDEKRERAPAQ